MSIAGQLSSRMGDRTSESNRQVAAQCLAKPALLPEIAEGLASRDAGVQRDCAEVLTMVALERPELVAPHATALTTLFQHRTTKARWEAVHALALVASLCPAVVASVLPRLDELIQHDASIIVRDYAVDAVGKYAGTSPEAASAVYPLLRGAVTGWAGKQAGHALAGLIAVAPLLPALALELQALAQSCVDDRRAVVRRAARRLVRAAEARASPPGESGDSTPKARGTRTARKADDWRG